jgi:hypothetical protein
MRSTVTTRRLGRVLAAASAGVSIVSLLGCSSPTAPTTRQTDVTSNATAHAEADATCVSIAQLVQPPTNGGTFSVSLSASCLWSVASDQPWLTTTSRPTAWSGNDTITYAVAPNTSTAARIGHLNISGGGGTTQLTLTQPGSGVSVPVCTYSGSPSTQSVPSGGGAFSASLITSCAWTASSDQPWLTLTSASSGSGDATITYAVAANTTSAARIGHLTVSGAGGTVQLTVTQNVPSLCTYALSPTTQSAPDGGGTFIVTLTAGCAWTASSNQPWLTIAAGASGSGNATITYTVSANTSGSPRTGQIAVSGAGGSEQLTVTQSAPSVPTTCNYSLSPARQSAPSGAGTFTVALTAGCTWTTQSDQPWLTITAGSSGSGNDTITYSVTANTSATARTGVITVSGPGGSAQLTVVQSGVCTYSLSPTTQSVSFSGGRFETNLTAGCAWTASSDQPWLTIASATSGTGDQLIAYSVASNSGAARTGHITVTGAGGTVQLTVNQDALLIGSLRSPDFGSIPPRAATDHDDRVMGQWADAAQKSPRRQRNERRMSA